MAKTNTPQRFRWTEQCQRAALLLSAMGHSNRKIAKCLNCSDSSVGRHLGPKHQRRGLSAAQLLTLFEQYDAQRNIEEVITAASGSTQQARLRTSLRVRYSKPDHDQSEPSGLEKEALSDEQLRREVEALVGHSIRVRD